VPGSSKWISNSQSGGHLYGGWVLLDKIVEEIGKMHYFTVASATVLEGTCRLNEKPTGIDTNPLYEQPLTSHNYVVNGLLMKATMFW
jgi:hypothetical protein